MAGLTAEQAYGLSQSEIKKVASGFDHAERTGDNTFSIFFVDGSKIDLTIPLPKDGEPGAKGDDGIGISKIEKIGTVGLVDTYRITFTDNSTFDYEVKNGADGQGGTGGSGEENTIESISVNGVNVEIDENKNVDITVPDAYDDTALSGRVDDVETSIGDMSTIKVKSVSDLVSAINTLYDSFMSSITYANKKLTITYRNGGTVDIDMSAIITDTNIGELSNIDDTGVSDKQVLSYDTATNKYIPTTIDTASVLADAKKYTDDEIAKINNADAIAVDEKPTYSDGTIIYKKDGVENTITDGDFWFFYTVDDMAYQTIWIDGVEFTTSVDGSVDFKDFVSKTNDLVSTYTGEETDKTKVTTIASLDALYAIISTALGKKVNTVDIVDSLVSDATDKPLSAAQGKTLDTEISELITTVEEDYAKTADIPTTLPANGGNADTVNNHTVESDVPVDAKFTDTVYDDTEVKESIEGLSSNLFELKVSDTSGGKNLQNVNSIVVKKAEVYITDYLLPIGTYTISFVSNTSGGIDFYSKELSDGIIGGVACQLKENQRVSKTFTVNSPTRLCSYSNITATLTEIQIEEGTTATEYEPYIPSVKMLAEENAQQNTEAMDLKMLGWTVPSECPIQNYVDGNGIFHQRVGRIDLGSLEWIYDAGKNNVYGFAASIPNAVLVENTDTQIRCFANGLNGVSASNIITLTSQNLVGLIRNNKVYVTSSYTSEQLANFIASMQDKYLYYELATPITMTIDENEVTERINKSLSVIGKCKNLLNPTLQTTTQNGVTCTNNGDGTYTLNGTASSDIILELESYKSYTGKEKFRLVGCPNGGSESKYYLAFRPNNAEENRKDIGSGVTFNDLSTSNKYAVAIIVLNGTTVTNLTFKPMLTTDLNATYDDFVPYTGDGETLTHDVAEIKNDLSKKFTINLYIDGDTDWNTIKTSGMYYYNGWSGSSGSNKPTETKSIGMVFVLNAGIRLLQFAVLESGNSYFRSGTVDELGNWTTIS